MPSDFYTNGLNRIDRQRQSDEERRRYQQGADMRLLGQLIGDKRESEKHRLGVAKELGAAAGQLGRDLPQFEGQKAEAQIAKIAQMGGEAQLEAAKAKAAADKDKALAVEMQRLERERLKGETTRDVAGIKGGYDVETTGMKEAGRTTRQERSITSKEKISAARIGAEAEASMDDQIQSWAELQDKQAHDKEIVKMTERGKWKRLMKTFENSKVLRELAAKNDKVAKIMSSMTSIIGRGMGSILPETVAEAKRLLPILNGLQQVYLTGGEEGVAAYLEAKFDDGAGSTYGTPGYFDRDRGTRGTTSTETTRVKRTAHIPTPDENDPALEEALGASVPPEGVEAPGWVGMSRAERWRTLESGGVIGEIGEGEDQ